MEISLENKSEIQSEKVYEGRFCLNSEGFNKDMDFEIFANVLCDRAVNKIKNGIIKNLEELMSFLAKEYQKFKQDPNDMFECKFGRDTRQCTTRLIHLEITPTESEKYSNYFLRFEKLSVLEPVFVGYIKYVPEMISKGDEDIYFAQYIFRQWQFDNNGKRKPKSILLVHGCLPPKTIEYILNLLESDFACLIDNNRPSEKDFFEHVSKIYWYLVNLHIYVRGNAAISDFVVETLARLNGIKLGSYKKDIIPDLEAMLLPVDEFIKVYKELFNSFNASEEEKPSAEIK